MGDSIASLLLASSAVCVRATFRLGASSLFFFLLADATAAAVAGAPVIVRIITSLVRFNKLASKVSARCAHTNEAGRVQAQCQ